MNKPISFFLFFLAMAVLCVPVAQARHFKVYGYYTLKPGEVELVYWTDYVADSDVNMTFFNKTGVSRDNLWAHTFEVEFGITDRWMMAVYADFEQPSGEALEFVQKRVVAVRYRFGEKGQYYFNPALYIEYYLPKPAYLGKAKEMIEARLILEREYGKNTLTLNPILEKVTSGPDVNEGLEFEYGASLYHRLDARTRLGLEIYGSLGELADFKSGNQQKHYLVPAVKYKLNKHLGWNLGAAFGLTSASDDLVIKSILEWEL